MKNTIMICGVSLKIEGAHLLMVEIDTQAESKIVASHSFSQAHASLYLL